MSPTTAVLTPKGTSGSFRWIGLLEIEWKIVERIIDARLECAPLNNALRTLRPGHGRGTGIMEMMLAQQLGIFLNLKKAYNAMDRDRCLKILRNMGVGEKTVRLIATF